MTPFTLQQLIDAVDGRPVGPMDLLRLVSRIETDSRRVRSGDLFWCLKGDRFDGHDFLNDVADRGAMACVVAEQAPGLPSPLPLPAVQVADTLAALWDLARWDRGRFDPLVIGVTGSVGKTTTRHLIFTVLSRQFVGLQNPGNLNNHIGLPLSVLGLAEEHEFAVFELGASRVGEIRELAGIAQPEVGVVTRVAATHLDHFGSVENIILTKGELLESLPPSGFAVINGDDAGVGRLAHRFDGRVIRVGEGPRNDLVATGVQLEDGAIAFCVDGSEFRLPAIGRHHLNSALLALGVAREVGMSDAEIAEGFLRFEAVPGRCRLVTVGEWLVIDDTYNASPASMKAACDALASWKGARKRILVLGDMLCLGEQSDAFHRELGAVVAAAAIDQLLAFGIQASTLAAAARSAGMDSGRIAATQDLATLTMLLDCWLEPGDVVLVKGSRGMQMERVLEILSALATQRAGAGVRRIAA